jgi:hypothetical protein
MFAGAAIGAASTACGGSSAANGDPSDDSGAIDTSTDADAPAPIPEIHLYSGQPEAEVSHVLFGELVDARVKGLLPNEAVTIRARRQKWMSWASFHASADGTIDLATAAPEDGTWDEADPDGPVWSMTPSDPSDDDPTDSQWSIAYLVEVDGAVVARALLVRDAIAAGVTKTSVSDDGLVGVFYAPPPGTTKRGVVIAFGGSEGGLDSGNELAAHYASLGYPSLGLAYFAAAGLPTDLSEVPLEYFDKAIDWTQSRAEVAAGKIVVTGGSRGGELAILLAAYLPRVTGAMAFMPSGVVWGAPQFDGTELSSWTLAGKPLPWIPYAGGLPKTMTMPDGSRAVAYTPSFQHDLASATPDQLAAATTPAEKSTGALILFGGDADQLWPSCALEQITMDRLTTSGHAATFGDASNCYADAGHNLEFLGYPTIQLLKIQHPITKEWLALGGTPKGIAKGQRDADTKSRAFLSSHL